MARTDTRFAAIDDAVALLKLLPAQLDDVVWPTDPGDREVVGEALRWLTEWSPRARAAFRAYCREQQRAEREQQRQARRAG